MAAKFDRALVDAARNEVKQQSKRNGVTAPTVAAPEKPIEPTKKTEPVKPAEEKPGADPKAAETIGTGPSIDPGTDSFIPEPDEFAGKFKDYFGSLGNFASGALVVELIDDLKANFLFIHAKKIKVEGVTKDMLKMEGKPKEFAAFLVDHAIKNNLMEWVKKYPLVAAVGVMGLSTAGSYMMLQALKNQKDEVSELKNELAKFKAAAAQAAKTEPAEAVVVDL